MPPPYVTSLDSYLDWIEALLDASGGNLVGAHLVFEYLQGGRDRSDGLLIRQHRLEFYDRTYLDFSFFVSDHLTCENYSFHYQGRLETPLWRKDMHDADHHGLGQVTHIHDSEEVAYLYPEVDLSEALYEIYAYQDTGRLPNFGA